MSLLHVHRTIVLLVVLFTVPVVPLAPATAQEPTREPIPSPVPPPKVAEFHPALLVGVRQLAREHIRIAELGIRIEQGDLSAQETLLAEVISALPEEERRAVRDDPPDAETAAQMLLSWKGWESFQEVVADGVKRGQPIRTEHLIEVLWSDRLRELPDERAEPEIAAFVQKIEAMAGRPVPVRLWWPTVGYLLFGALHTPSFWPQDEAERVRARADLIQELLEITTVSDDSEGARLVVDAALAPPLRGECARKAVTCAREKLAHLRGPVGFTVDHLAFVSRFNQDGEAERRTGAPSSPWGANFHHLADFMAMMKLRILLELDPSKIEKPGPLSCKYGTVAESLAYYKMVLETRDVQSFWIEAREDVLKILAGRFPHLHDAKIAALDERLADPTLSEEVRAALTAERATIAGEREDDQQKIASFLVFQFGDRAPIEQAVSELRQLDGHATPNQQTENLMSGWLALGLRDSGWATQAVTAHLDGTQPASTWCISGAALALQNHADDPDCGRALFELATRGAPDDRSTAMLNTGKVPDELARGMYDVAVNDLEELLRRSPDVQARKPFGDDALYSTLLRSAIRVLHARGTSSWERQELAKTFDRDDVNLWKGGSPFAPDLGFGNREILEWVVDTLGEEDYQRLARRGRIPADLGRVHDERRR